MLFLILVLVSTTAHASDAVNDLVNVRRDSGVVLTDNCRTDWAPDYEMVIACVYKQAESIRGLQILLRGIRAGTPDVAAMQQCADNWYYTSKPDITMTVFCYQQYRKSPNRRLTMRKK